ncbi:MAG: hypothetical protein WDM77_08660 [Steroidobacteraceae bacterium]
MDSSLILDYAQALGGRRSLMPNDILSLKNDLRVIGLGLAACEKSVQIIYERGLRPPEKQHEPWIERVTGQLLAALEGLEAEVVRQPPAGGSAQMMQAGVTTAVTWYFCRQDAAAAGGRSAVSGADGIFRQLRELPQFKAAAHGAGTCITRGLNQSCGCKAPIPSTVSCRGAATPCNLVPYLAEKKVHGGTEWHRRNRSPSGRKNVIAMIAGIREKAGLSQSQFANLLGRIGTHAAGLGAGPPGAVGCCADAAAGGRQASEDLA